MAGHEHWDAVYGIKGSQDVSWYQPHLDRSLKFIDQAGRAPDAAIVDVGGGSSTLVDDLLIGTLKGQIHALDGPEGSP